MSGREGNGVNLNCFFGLSLFPVCRMIRPELPTWPPFIEVSLSHLREFSHLWDDPTKV